MILQRSVISCARTNMYRSRSISLSSMKAIADDRKKLPSRKLFVELTEKAYMDEKLTRSGHKPFEAMVEKPIIVKSFFISELESEEIEYPETMTKEDLKKISETISKIADDRSNAIKSETVNKQIDFLKQFKLFGTNIPKCYGGQDYTNTERALISEVETQNVGIAKILNAHRLVSSTICEYGTDEQCKKYLPKLASGEMIGTIAFKEWNTYETQGLKTRAEYNDDSDSWYLKGTKALVVNAPNANVFLVLAQTKVTDRQGDLKNSLSIFIVDESTPGVKVHPVDNTIGSSDSNHARVTFDDIELTNDALVSLAGAGTYLENQITINSRINEGIASLTQMKKMMKYMVNMVTSIEQEVNASKINESTTLRTMVGKYTHSIYALESMLYLTTGIMDKYKNTNIDLESAIFKISAQDQFLNMAMDLLNFVDSRVTIDEHPVNSLIRNAIQSKFDDSKTQAKLNIAREGIQYRLHRLIEERQNKDFLMKNFLTEQQLDMYEPEMRGAAKSLFDSVVLLRLCASTITFVESTEKNARDSEITKLAEAACFIYESYACLLRANRSIKQKLYTAEQECAIAKVICDRNHAEIKKLTKYVDDGPVRTFEKYHEYMTHLMLQPDIEFPAHPLTRFF